MQLFQVKSPSGELIMNAPLETIQRVWRVSSPVLAHILRYTKKLDQEYILQFAAEHHGWPKSLHIQRLPMEIPSTPLVEQTRPWDLPGTAPAVSTGAVVQAIRMDELEQRRQVHSQTILGELLCDE